jgi:hypothetical protein
LIGVTQEVDEENIDKFEFLRAIIIVLDISKFPVVAPGILGTCMYDFHLTLEIIEDGNRR